MSFRKLEQLDLAIISFFQGFEVMEQFENSTKTIKSSFTEWITRVVVFLFALPYVIVRYSIVFSLSLYAALLPFDNLLGLGEAGTLTKYLGILIIITLWANRIIIVRGHLLKPPPITWSWALFLLLAGISGLWAFSPADTFSSLYTLAGLFLIYLSVGVYPFTKNDYSLLTKFVIVGGVCAAAYIILIYLRGITLPQSVRASLIWGAERRADPNHLVTSLILPLLFSLGWLTQPYKRHKIWALISIVVIAVAILLTGSRGGALGAAVAVLLFFWRIRHHISWYRMIIIFLIVVTLTFFVLTFIPIQQQLFERFSLEEILKSRGASRFFIWHTGFKAFLHRPLVGYGYNNFPYAYDLFKSAVPGAYRLNQVAHNIYLQSFVELGMFGGLLLLLIAWLHWRIVNHMTYRSNDGIALEAAFIGILVSSFTLGTLYYKYFWFAFSLIILLINIKKGESI
jgi:O-antigen ligase